MTAPQQLGRKLAVVGLSVLLTLGGLEAAIRFLTDQQRRLLLKDELVGHRYRTNFTGTRFNFESRRQVPLRFNRYGFRGPDWSATKPANVRRVALLGDSYAAAVEVDEEDTMAARLETALNRLATGKRWQVLNFGVSNTSTAEQLLVWRHFARRFDPDLVILCFFNGNDLSDNTPAPEISRRPCFTLEEDGQLLLHLPPASRRSLSAWLDEHSRFYLWQKHKLALVRGRMRAARKNLLPRLQILNTAPPTSAEMAWVITERLLLTWADEVRATGAKPVLVVIPAHEQIMDSYWEELIQAIPSDIAASFDASYPESRLRNLSAEHDIPLIALREVFRAASLHRSLHFPRAGHWTEAGHRLAADTLVHELSVAGNLGTGNSETARIAGREEGAGISR